MFVADYYTQSNESFTFSRQNGSDFAKQVAGDFNPLHDIDNKRFCVPGDLLFSLCLSQFGVSESMSFDFQGMISGDSRVHFVESENEILVKDQNDKRYLSVSRSGAISKNETFVEGLIRSYVAFSGKTFPHILVELMQKEDVMINPARPMVIYDHMSLTLKQFTDTAPEVILNNSQFDVNGKRGIVTMNFDLQVEGQSIGSGEKHIIMSGLRPYEQSGIDLLVKTYDEAREAYFK